MKSCACSITTSLFELCDDCYNKAWDNAEILRKREQKLELLNDPNKNYPHSSIIYTADDKGFFK